MTTKDQIDEIVTAWLSEDWEFFGKARTITSQVNKLKDKLMEVVENSYNEGFSDGEMEAAGDCLCDCKKCNQCEFKKKLP